MSSRTKQSQGSREAATELEPDGLTRIFAMLHDRTKVDFTHYKQRLISRLLERRMHVTETHELGDYARFLEERPGEISSLYRDLLIGVTSFFRDREAFEALREKWLPDLLQRGVNRRLRFWVAGCSTGEEAFSLAMSCREVMEQLKLHVDIEVFATDIDGDAIRYAEKGVYPVSIAADLPQGFRTKYFIQRNDGFQVVHPIREMVVFIRHNLFRDPPFINIEFISCRNLLIYLQPTLQRKTMELFKISLNPEGILFLGSCETTGEFADHFDSLNYKSKIYRLNGRKRPVTSKQTARRTDPGV
jgi:two-component system, chemotaxis family, CheB/CheR fusion protein